MTVENPPFEDVFFPVEHGDFPASHVGFPGCNILQFLLSSFFGGRCFVNVSLSFRDIALDKFVVEGQPSATCILGVHVASWKYAQQSMSFF